ncbi:glycosyltransferase [Pseudactinotalea sp. Z1748]|uniref:glycosyltransferase n=1 Tax=Pseudactinotalea sp. Z1748 TaxID=3413027 RepID=UPI003C7E4DF6
MLNPRVAGLYARVLAHQTPQKEKSAIELLAFLRGLKHGPRLADRDVTLYAQLLAKHRRWHELERQLSRGGLQSRIPKDILASLRSDLANPFLYSPKVESAPGFLELFNEAVDFSSRRRVISLRDSHGMPFDRLHGLVPTREHGPLVSVVTSCFNPDQGLLVAARSLQEQTWENWEMLVVDDGSTEPESRALLIEVERLDNRIRVIRKAVNGGTYRARNTAMRLLRGDFVTFLDSDDWAHPDRLTAGVLPMLQHRAIPATLGPGLRVSEELELNRPGYSPHFPAASSLMFRFPEVPARIGFFDSARKGADTEYLSRIASAFGQPVHELSGRALTLLRRTEDSLSATDFSFGWRHPARWAYKQSYGMSHQSISVGGDAYRAPENPSPHFGVHRWAKAGDPEYSHRRRFDVVFLGDWRRHGGPQVSMMEEISALLAQGFRIGVAHVEAMRFRSDEDEPLSEPLRELLRDGDAELVFLDEDVDVDLLIVRYPPILQFPSDITNALQPGRVLIMANQAPAESDGTDQRYVPADVHRHTRNLFGVAPLWVPQGPTIRALLAELLPREVIASWDNPGILDPEQWYVERDPLPAAGLVVGRYSRDTGIKFPSSAEDLLKGYGFETAVDVRLMGATRTVRTLLEQHGGVVPPNWSILPEGSVPVKEFLQSLDVVIYLDDPGAYEAFGRVLLESAASGALVIASPKHEPTFGDALLYANPSETVDLIRQLRADPARVARQRHLTRRRVHERWSRATFTRRVLDELAVVRGSRLEISNAAEVTRGHVTFSRRDTRLPMNVHSETAEVGILSALVRREADAEMADAVAVVHCPTAAAGAEGLLNEIRASFPGGATFTGTREDTKLPRYVWAVVSHIDGEWRTRTAPGWESETSGDSIHLAVTGT